MLAQNFKTATDLGITEAEHGALQRVLGMLERGEIHDPDFTMKDTGDYSFWKGGSCLTPACICGWARHLSCDPHMFHYERRPQDLNNLFVMGADRPTCATIGNHAIATPQAAIALRNYLTHGEPRWEEALA